MNKNVTWLNFVPAKADIYFLENIWYYIFNTLDMIPYFWNILYSKIISIIYCDTSFDYTPECGV